jgi:hypothetical protein
MIARALVFALLGTFLTGASEKRSDVRIVVVVNVANPVSEMPRDRLSKIFLREIGEWPNGKEILPVDQIDKAPARFAFARDIQGQSLSALKRYWQERIFSGSESPPPDRVTDADVLTYVRSNPGAIGYVVEGTDLGPGVKPVIITDTGRDANAVSTHS